MNEKEIIELIKKHIKVVENPQEDAIDVYIKCNGLLKITLPRSYNNGGHYDIFTGKVYDWDEATQDTKELELFKEAFSNE